MNAIEKDTKIKEAKSILEAHGCQLSFGWEIVLENLLEECDYIEVKGYGERCILSLKTKE